MTMEPRVGLMILGAQKCATTSLFYLLADHPMICGSVIKETDFFALSPDWRCELHKYHALFNPGPGQILMEASPSYTLLPFRKYGIWEDIYAYNPAVKLIYVVRNPVERIISAYMHRYQRGMIHTDIHTAIVKDAHLLTGTRYYSQVSPYFRRFGSDQILLLDFDDVTGNLAQVSAQIAKFAGISLEGFKSVKETHRNKGLNSGKRHVMWDRGTAGLLKKIAPKIWRRLSLINRRQFSERPTLHAEEKAVILQLLELEIDHLEPLMGKSLQHWKAIDVSN